MKWIRIISERPKNIDISFHTHPGDVEWIEKIILTRDIVTRINLHLWGWTEGMIITLYNYQTKTEYQLFTTYQINFLKAKSG